MKTSILALAASLAFFAVPVSAAPVITTVGSSFATTPFSFKFGDNIFTFSGTGDGFNPTAISTGGNAQVNTIFGAPTTNFVDRGSLTFGPNDQYAAFTTPTTIRFSNGQNFIGLKATNGQDIFYGFAYTTDNILNSYGFETVAGVAITPTVAAGAVPESATWLMMIAGFGIVGGTMRSRRNQQIARISN